jgi:hypothetical protein
VCTKYALYSGVSHFASAQSVLAGGVIWLRRKDPVVVKLVRLCSLSVGWTGARAVFAQLTGRRGRSPEAWPNQGPLSSIAEHRCIIGTSIAESSVGPGWNSVHSWHATVCPVVPITTAKRAARQSTSCRHSSKQVSNVVFIAPAGDPHGSPASQVQAGNAESPAGRPGGSHPDAPGPQSQETAICSSLSARWRRTFCGSKSNSCVCGVVVMAHFWLVCPRNMNWSVACGTTSGLCCSDPAAVPECT